MPTTQKDKVLLKTGAICRSMIRCGKPGCKCAGGQLHGPYYYRFYRDRQGKQHRQYIPKADAEAALQAQESDRDGKRIMRDFFRANWADYRRIKAEIREMLRPYQEYRKAAH